MNDAVVPALGHILLVEDDPIGGRQLARFLRSFGYQVTLVTGQAAALEQLAAQRFQGFIIDLTLTDGDGYGVLEAVRARDPFAPILCTSGQSDLSARVLGLKAGFDHYLGKPFEPLELEALLAAALRRHQQYTEHQDGAEATAAPQRWEIYPGERCLTLHRGARIPLSEAELRFLRLLRDQAPATVDRRAIIVGLGQAEAYYSRSRLDAMVSRLRQKIALLTPEPPPFKSVYAAGYVWVQASARDTMP
jgi:DNA-binding response OmpR family regulator